MSNTTNPNTPKSRVTAKYPTAHAHKQSDGTWVIWSAKAYAVKLGGGSNPNKAWESAVLYSLPEPAAPPRPVYRGFVTPDENGEKLSPAERQIIATGQPSHLDDMLHPALPAPKECPPSIYDNPEPWGAER